MYAHTNTQKKEKILIKKKENNKRTKEI